MDELERNELLEYVDNDEVRALLEKPAEVRQMIYSAMNEMVDSTALSSARKLMSSPETPDRVKADFILGWLAHRRANKELMHKIASGDSGGISLTFNVGGTDREEANVKRVRSAFGLGDKAEDAQTE